MSPSRRPRRLSPSSCARRRRRSRTTSSTRRAPGFGLIAAAGPRSAAAPGEYALVVEAVREGYLLHYGEPRLLAGHDDDLALLAGDYLYALGHRAARRAGRLRGGRCVLADLIGGCARLHAEGREDEVPGALALRGAIAGRRQDDRHSGLSQ